MKRKPQKPVKKPPDYRAMLLYLKQEEFKQSERVIRIARWRLIATGVQAVALLALVALGVMVLLGR